MTMRIEMWADVTCPWCGIGAHRLQQALDRFEHRDHVEVVHRSFVLDPSLEAGAELISTRELLRHKYGLSDEQADAATSNVQDIARGDGLQPYVVSDNVVGSTQLAHEFLAWATTKGKHADAWHRISRRYFGEAKSIFDIGSLADVATELGLDATDAREALESGEYRSAVEADVRLGHERGVAGVPFFVIDERYAVSGAHPTETLLEVIRGAWDETPRAVVSSA